MIATGCRIAKPPRGTDCHFETPHHARPRVPAHGRFPLPHAARFGDQPRAAARRDGDPRPERAAATAADSLRGRRRAVPARLGRGAADGARPPRQRPTTAAPGGQPPRRCATSCAAPTASSSAPTATTACRWRAAPPSPVPGAGVGGGQRPDGESRSCPRLCFGAAALRHISWSDCWTR